MSENENENEEVVPDIEEEKYKEISLQLGDVVKIVDTENDQLNNQTFMIDYIDTSKIILLNTTSFDKYILKIQENGTLGNGTIQEIHILWRSEYPGYARQNNLLPGLWINLYFSGDVPTIITGQISNLEEDMIEIQTYPEKDIIYINFEYKGIPEDIPIETIEIREAPGIIKTPTLSETEKLETPEFKKTTPEEIAQMDKDEQETMVDVAEDSKFVPTEKVNDQLREFILQADEIEFGIGEDLGEVIQYIDVGKRRQRFDVQAQANDLLDEMLSTIPNSERTGRVLQNIHTMIERFKQLRLQFSTFDEYGNVEGALLKTPTWKPLLQELLKFNKILYWILPVVKNIKKIYDQGVTPYQDVVNLNTKESLMDIDELVKDYKSNNSSDEQNKYISLITDMNKYFTPFASVDAENMSDVIYEKAVGENLNVVVDNLGDFYSTVVDNDRIKSRRFIIEKYNLGASRLLASHFTGSKMIAQRIKLTQPDEMSIKSLLTMREPVVRFSRIHLPGTNILDRANLNTSFLQYWQLLNKNTNVNNVIVDEFDLEKEKNKKQTANATATAKGKELPEFIEEEYYEKDENLEEGEVPEMKTRLVKNPDFVEKETYPILAQEKQDNNFLKHVTNYMLIAPESEEVDFKRDELYQKFLEKVVPKTNVLFKLIKKYIVDKVSIVDAVSYLEPFLVYSDDLTYMQYKDIVQFLDTTVSEYNKNFVEKSRAFQSVKNIWTIKKKNSSVEAIYHVIRDNAEQIMDIDYRCGINNSNGEILTRIVEKDAGKLYNSAIAFQNMSLMFHDSMHDILNQEKKEYSNRSDEEKAKDKCTTYVIAKQYTSEEELMADNGKQIYFDKKYDKTNYSMLEDYVKEMTSMDPELFINFLVEKLQKKLKITQGEADYLVDTLIGNIKEVVDGQYAFIYNIAESTDNIYYYKRVKGRWIADDGVDKSFFVTDDNILCNIKKDCIDVQDKCISTDLNKTTLIKQTLDNALNEFDKKYSQTKEEMEKRIEQEFQYNKSVIDKLGKIEFDDKFQYNNIQFLLGAKTSAYQSEKEALIKISPFQHLRDLILGESDFVKKQNDIIRFALNFTRESANKSIEESVHWRYCIKTNVPLLPTFLYSMASIFINNPGNYLREVDAIIKEIGKLSDDGDAWVDQHSGYIIRKIDFDVEEGYEESGFKVKSRDLIEQESGDLVMSPSKSPPTFQTHEIKISSNIVTALSTYMGIQMDDQREFIIQNVTSAFKQAMPSEKEYKQHIEVASKKGKTVPGYKELYNSTLLYMTFAMFLIGVQTSIPSIKTRKTYPGCIRSFKGYPFQGTGDDSSVQYLACVAYNIRSVVEPWNVLMKKKDIFIADKIKLSIDTYFLNNPNVVRKFQEKAEYLITSPIDTTIPDEHDIKNWHNFLPPLLPFKIVNLTNITSEFKSKLVNEMKHGGIYQREKLMVVASKIIFFSLALQEKIHKIIRKKQPLLTNMNNEAFIENACCNEKALKNGQDYSVIDYFINEDPEIASYNNIVNDLSNLLYDVDSITKAPWLFSKESTKNIYPSVKQEFNEDTIYRAFIVYCNFTNLLPISDALFSVCSEKPSYILPNDTTTEIIKKLKNDGRIYNNASLLRLLQTVGRERIVRVEINLPYSSPVETMRNIIKHLDESGLEEMNETVGGAKKSTSKTSTSTKNNNDDDDKTYNNKDKSEFKLTQPPSIETESDLIYPSLRKMLLTNINSFELSLEIDTQELRFMKNHLARTNQEMKLQIIQFIKDHNNVADRKLRNIDKLLTELTTWNGIRFGEELDSDTDAQKRKISDDTGYNCINFIKSYIQNFVKTFPNIILNTVDYSNIHVNNYWGLSLSHASDIKTLVGKYYAELRPFYSDKFLSTLLMEMPNRGENLIKLADETPYFTSSQDPTKHSTFDKRTSSMLFEHYFLLILMEYINLTDDDSMLFVEDVKRDIFGDIFTVESLEDTEQHLAVTSDDLENEIILEGNKKQLKTTTANLLVAYFLIMREHKNIVDDGYDSIMDKVFKLREKEKDDTTDRKKKMTDDERGVDTIMQINKLGVWGKGLEKGLTVYQKETYDEDRQQAEEFANLERKLKKQNKNVTDHNVDQYMEDLAEETETDRLIEKEEYDMTRMTENYWDGNPYGDEEEYEEDYNN